MAAVALRQEDGTLTDPDELVGVWRDRITQAREARKPFEPTWLSNLAFAAGQHWLAWDERQRTMRHLSELDEFYADRELYTADVITEQRAAALGELSTGDDRPQLLLAQEGDNAELIQQAINQAVGYGWEHEWKADVAIEQARRLCLDFGFSAIRVRRDPTLGPVVANVPHLDGQPITDEGKLAALDAYGRGQLELRDIHEGVTVWEPLSALNLLTPPGVVHEDAFPWEIVVRPVLIDKVEEEFGEAAAGLTEDGDVASVIGLSTDKEPRNPDGGPRARLRGHVWLFTGYERPCRRYPQGQVVHLASNSFRLLRVDPQLPYQGADGSRRTGISYFHWWRLNDRFQSRAFIEGLKDPQRMINRRRTQAIEIGDRSMPYVIVETDSKAIERRGTPMETIEVGRDEREPKPVTGMNPGTAWQADVEAFRQDLSHASTLAPLRLGENPASVDTYSQLALLNENEALKRSAIRQDQQRSIARLVEDSLFDIRRYWPPEKQILVAGDEGQLSQQAFEKSKIPDFYVVRPAQGSAQPRSQGAELKKVDSIWQAALASGVAVNPAAAEAWLRWYADSLEAGQALDLPEDPGDEHVTKAQRECQMMADGEDVTPAYYDPPEVHIPIERSAQVQAEMVEDWETWRRIEKHIQMELELARENAARIAAEQPDPLTEEAPADAVPA